VIDDHEVTDAGLDHLLGGALEAPVGRGGDGAVAHVIGDHRLVGVEAPADREQHVALGDDARCRGLLVEHERGARALLGHLGRGLAQSVVGPDGQNHAGHPLANFQAGSTPSSKTAS
jgi:hypothetical protein